VRADDTLASSLHRVLAMRILAGVVIAHLVVGCYHPDVRDCTVQCSAATDCTSGQVCNHGWCTMPEAKECPKGGAVGIDAATASGSDAPQTLCSQGCSNGSCVDGVCVIDCSAPNACQNDINCPANLPCRVVCGDNACAKPIKCGSSTSCEVQCIGDHACGDEIQCNSQRCDVDCSGPSSCERRTRCLGSCACDVSCSGGGSCPEPSECPASACKLGNGCTSLAAGCDDC
jgi:hypothetical protein